MGLFSCNSDEKINFSDSELIESYLEENDLRDSIAISSTGIYYRILQENPSGATPATGEVVGIFFIANAINEQAYDSHVNEGSNEPLRFQYNTSSVFPVGIDNCISLMKIGEIGEFYIPSSLAYGDLEDVSSIIPDHAAIKIVIELSTIETQEEITDKETVLIENFILENELNDSIYADIDSVMIPVDSVWVTNESLTQDSVMIPLDSIWYDVVGGAISVDTVFHYVDSVELLPSGIYYKTLEDGQEGDYLNSDESVYMNYSIYFLEGYPGSVVDMVSSPEVFTYTHMVGEVIDGLDIGVAVMERQERALLIIPSFRAYGGSALVIPQNQKSYFVENNVIPDYASVIPPYKVLVFDIQLLETPIP